MVWKVVLIIMKVGVIGRIVLVIWKVGMMIERIVIMIGVLEVV